MIRRRPGSLLLALASLVLAWPAAGPAAQTPDIGYTLHFDFFRTWPEAEKLLNGKRLINRIFQRSQFYGNLTT